MTNNDNAFRIDRRRFLGTSAIGAAATLSAPAWLPRIGWAGTAGTSRDTLVIVFLRGGSDGLSMCPPWADPDLGGLRQALRIPPPGNQNGAIDLDGFFGFAPAMAPLMPAYQNGHLAVVHATGLSESSRSHFDMQRLMEFGVTSAGGEGITTGWAGRYLDTILPLSNNGVRGLGIENALPRSLAGGPKCVAAKDLAAFTMPGNPATAPARSTALTSMHAGEPFPLGPSALNAFVAMELLSAIDFEGYVPANGVQYPDTPFGKKLESAAALIKAGVGVEVIQADLGGWDHHNQQGPLDGQMAALMEELAGTLADFERDLSDTNDTIGRVTVVVMSEFGRRAKENASQGTDHGSGNCMLVMGGHVNGGQVFSDWPGLADGELDDGDLAITIDYRHILAEILTDRMSCTDLAAVFPSFTPVFRNITS
jgi:uncharacterized protein (DUF1501 family)